MSKVQITMTEHGRGEVLVDGRKVEGVRSIEFRAGVDEVNSVCLDISAAEVVINGCVDVSTIGDKSRRFRLATAWERLKGWAMRPASGFGPG